MEILQKSVSIWAAESAIMVLYNMFAAFNLLQHRNDDDISDRLNYLYTPSFLIMMSILVSFKQYAGKPLECWVPPQFTDSWQAYTETYCWAQNTYFVPIDDIQLPEPDKREEGRVSYYQWVPFFLLAQAFKFYFPCLIWRLLNDKSGVNLHDIVTAAKSPENINPEVRDKAIASLGKHIESFLEYQRADHGSPGGCNFFHIRYQKKYLTGLYLFCKILFVANSAASLFLLNMFLVTGDGKKFPKQVKEASSLPYGLGVLSDLLHGRSWKESGNFPRVALCDFHIRAVGGSQRHSAQCMMVINIFNEKIFILLWFWLSLLIVLTVCDLIYWFVVCLRRSERLKFVLRHVDVKLARAQDRKLPSENMQALNSRIREDFIDYLQHDGHFVLRMVGLHAGLIFCSELTKKMWQIYLERNNLSRFKPGRKNASMFTIDMNGITSTNVLSLPEVKTERDPDSCSV